MRLEFGLHTQTFWFSGLCTEVFVRCFWFYCDHLWLNALENGEHVCKMSYVATQVLRPRFGWPDTTNWLKVNVNDICFCVYVRTAVVSPCVISVNMKSNVVVFSANCINRFWILFIWFLFWCVPKTDDVWRRALVCVIGWAGHVSEIVQDMVP